MKDYFFFPQKRARLAGRFYTFQSKRIIKLMQSQEMERLCSLFFELSNEDRLSIILKLMDEPMKLTHIAKALDLTVQDGSRQLSRLTDIDLVTKYPDGFFVLQPYGRHAFRLFPGFQFLTEHVEYFNKHTLTGLPEKFMGRVGELRGCVPVTALMKTFANIETYYYRFWA